METWERRSEWPLTVLAVAFLGVYAVPILDQGLTAGERSWCLRLQWVVWSAFVVDYLVRLALTDRRRHFIWSNLLDLAVILLPMLRPLRLLRLVTLLRIVNRSASASLRGRVITYVVGGSAVLAFVAALAMLDAERGHDGANISSFGDALWWAMATMTTVGYGDRFPVTVEGLAIAVGLMVDGPHQERGV